MANVNASIEELTASLQELTAHSYNSVQPQRGQVQVDELQIPQEVEAFVEATRDYAARTRSVSEGCY